MKEEKTERCRSTIKRRSKRPADDNTVKSSAIRSESYIVPGNPMKPNDYDEPAGETFRCVTKYEPRLSKHESFMLLRDLKTPLQPILRSEKGSQHIKRESDVNTPTGLKLDNGNKSTHGLVLPDIGMTAFLCSDKRAGEIRDALDQPSSQFIRHTRSGIAYNFMYGPPTGKPRRLPKIVSDGAIQYNGNGSSHDLERIPSAHRSRKKHLRVNGEDLAEQLRSNANRSRLERERKNLEKAKCQLQLQEDRASRLGCRSRAGRPTQTLIEDNASRIRQVKAKQDEIREKQHIRKMERVVKRMKRS